MKNFFMKHALFIISFLMTQSVIAQSTDSKIDSVRQAELLHFLKHDCGSCHGMTLKGGLGPALLPEILSAKPTDFLVTTILEGRLNTAMPPWKSMLSYDDALWITEKLQSGQTGLTKPSNEKP